MKTDIAITPMEMVEFLDRYIVGQKNAKRCISIALRNRWRRLQVSDDLKEEIMPKNIIMIGPTGVGKTEIARRIAKKVNSPFIKVEASKFTEVGYVGRDVESMVRDLVEISINMVRKERMKEVKGKAATNVDERILDVLIPPTPVTTDDLQNNTIRDDSAIREKFAKKLANGELEDRMIEVNVSDRPSGPSVEFFPISGNEGMDLNIKDMMNSIFPKQKKNKKVSVKDARKLFQQEEEEKLIDMESLQEEAVRRVEQGGIIFLDEIDKVARSASNTTGGDVSREGVQRDLLPIVEGSTVNTKYGPVKTDHILFIAAGAFHLSKPSDMIPELQGRFPIRVELDSLTKSDFIRILKEPKNSLIKQYIALLKTEDLDLIFEDVAIEEIAGVAYEVNAKTENIGARRLHAVLEKLLDEVSFTASDEDQKEVRITKEYVAERLSGIVRDQDLSRYIL